ncbi:glycoside hydrolase family 20 zincin-like fold domain-containing protein [Chryseolinea lacunae]|uniref:Family 20 glycosylhydrolase n=1 Tax=Chryseolinea lacunae TaxID=2801331 RepID=A0ABS1L1A0_9BACT|nr:glycoside hydrolase family 20 zincin-like fold domain-containing protein [Chryseolinea lacunae]MBL0745287.1 family 20 glycosylhydrolase [Chryseolinea lacunae]
MKPGIKLCIALVLVTLHAAAGDLADFQKHFRILPHPQKIELLTGAGLSATTLRGFYLANGGERPILPTALAGLPLRKTGGAGMLTLKLQPDLALPSDEGYVLEISGGQATILGRQNVGLFYGLQTLGQLLEDARDQQLEIPACRITDYPEIAYRAIHLDMKHHLEAGHYYYSIIDRLASIKVNAIIIEFEDKLRYRKAPLVGAANAISIEEFAAISQYAHERHVEISPLVQGLGHASFILKHEAYAKLRDDPASDWVFDPLNPETYDVQFALYEDAMKATPYGKYLHVGGDEVGSLGKSERNKQSGMKPLELQMLWLKKVTDFAVAHNRIPIFWDDMVFKLADLYETTYDASIPVEQVNARWQNNQSLLEKNIALFPKTCVYMRWNYDDPTLPGNQRAIDWYNAHALKAMAATSAQPIYPMLPRNQSNFKPIKDYCRLTSEKKMAGILCTAWDDCAVHFETIWRGLYDFGLFSWNYEDVPMAEAHADFRQRFYSPALAEPSADFQDALEDALKFWETALLKEGDRDNYHKDFKLVDLPDAKKPGAWSAAYKTKLDGARQAVQKYTVIQDKIRKAQEVTNRNQYALDVMEQINTLQIFSARQLILLEQLDKAPANQRKAVAAQLMAYTKSFEAVRKQFEKVYGETRILGNPEGYQLDSNFHHHLANGTNNTDWMYVYELAMNKKVEEWLSRQALTND